MDGLGSRPVDRQPAYGAGPGGAVRRGWFSNLYAFDLLDNKIQQAIDRTGPSVSVVESAAARHIRGTG